ncbi:MAG: DNA/RNA non-specific endonuclease [Neisseria sp.]|nr:DNA/RNA non-specific endonuclease [Neisseria sp.]
MSYALSPPSHHAQPNITYGSLDVFGRSTGVSAIINASTLRTGSWANPNIRPQGFLGGINNHARSHLLARILGGNGSDARNLTTLYQRNANHPNMSSFENTIVKRVESGETIRLRVIPIYKSFYPAPTGITLEARGSNGFKMNVSVPNQDSTLNLFGK